MRVKFQFEIVILFTLLIASTGLPQGYVCAIGGGTEDYNSWSDDPYRWIVQKSDSGKIVVLSANTETSWIPDYFVSFGASQAVNLRINSRVVADLQSTYDQIISARAVFIKGGDQWNYINYWKGTKTEDAIKYVFINGGVVAGTSAGLAVLGSVDYTARLGSMISKEGLQNPLSSAIDLEDNFLNLVPGVIFDSHFIERGRFGRLIAFIYNCYYTRSINILGAGVDDRTAVCIEPDGIGTVMGSGALAVFQKDSLTVYQRDGNYISVNNLKCDQLTHGWKYDFTNRKIFYVPVTAKPVDTSRSPQYPMTDVWLSGQNNLTAVTTSAFDDFLNNVNTQRVAVIGNQGYFSHLETVSAYLAARSISCFVFPVNNSSVGSQDYADSLEESTAIVLLGDSLNVLMNLADTGKAAGIAFIRKIFRHKFPAFFFGNAGKTIGGNYVDKTDQNYLNSYRGLMTNNKGLAVFGDLIYQPLIFNNSDFYENRTSALLWGMMLNRKRLGIYLDDNDWIRIDHQKFTVVSSGPMPLMVVSAKNTTFVDSSVFVAGSGYKTRQVAAMNELRYFISNINKTYSIDSNSVITSADECGLLFPEPGSFKLCQNYPNPFNPSTVISFSLPSDDRAEIAIYNVTGQRVRLLVSTEMKAGMHDVSWDGRNDAGNSLPSGIYFYRMRTSSFNEVKKLIMIK